MTEHRKAIEVMRLARMGAYHQNRLSFMRILLRYLKLENWVFSRPHWEVNDQGVGYAVYEAKGPRRTYSLVAFSHDLPEEQRSDRVIAQAWDATFALFDGVPSKEDILRLIGNVPYQEAGRILKTELSLSRANRSSRLWSHVVDALAQGQQPDEKEVEKIGYLMRTTAVYGSGKFGAGDRGLMEDRTALSIPFLVEMLNVYLTREFTLDLVEHVAKAKGGEKAVVIERNLRRKFGIGNSTGLGLAPFLVNHPALLHAWVFAKEEAYRRVRDIAAASEREKQQFIHYLKRAQIDVAQWHSEHEVQQGRIKELATDLQKLEEHLQTEGFSSSQPWEQLYQWTKEDLSLEGQELFLTLMLEPYGEVVDELAKILSADEESVFAIDGSMEVAAAIELLKKHYGWALEIDFNDPSQRQHIWYTSVEKQEPRLGDRTEDGVLADYEQPLCIAYDVSRLYQQLGQCQPNEKLADILGQYPEFRHVVRRMQIVAHKPYAEICDNLTSKDIFPIDFLRFKLAYFGATKFDPRSNLWVRICMYQNAPFADELGYFPCDDWVYPPLKGEV
ncbi:MAG: hypothetical protein ACK5MJ_01000 [Alphaproteobacteria bacterium]